jgi:mannose-6-phosphate isomerase-like protein (cupin superfamily)
MYAAPLAGNPLAPEGASIVLVEWRAEPGGGDPPLYIAPLHLHRSDDEAWYVLEGTLGFILGDERVEVPAGGAAIAQRGVPHTFWNPHPEPARYVLAMTPRIKSLIDSLHDGSGRSPEEVFAAHDSELLGWP